MIFELSSGAGHSVRTVVKSRLMGEEIWITFYEDVRGKWNESWVDVILKPDEAADLVAKILEHAPKEEVADA